MRYKVKFYGSSVYLPYLQIDQGHFPLLQPKQQQLAHGMPISAFLLVSARDCTFNLKVYIYPKTVTMSN